MRETDRGARLSVFNHLCEMHAAERRARSEAAKQYWKKHGEGRRRKKEGKRQARALLNHEMRWLPRVGRFWAEPEVFWTFRGLLHFQPSHPFCLSREHPKREVPTFLHTLTVLCNDQWEWAAPPVASSGKVALDGSNIGVSPGRDATTPQLQHHQYRIRYLMST